MAGVLAAVAREKMQCEDSMVAALDAGPALITPALELAWKELAPNQVVCRSRRL